MQWLQFVDIDFLTLNSQQLNKHNHCIGSNLNTWANKIFFNTLYLKNIKCLNIKLFSEYHK